MKLKYVGPHAQVEVPELGAVASVGDVVEATGDTAQSLISTGLWEKTSDKPAKQEEE